MALTKGMLLGFANTIVVAAGIAAAEPIRHSGVFALVLVYGFVPGILTGATLGLVAGALRLRPAVRIALLLGPAVGVVALLGTVFQLGDMIAPACIPTAAGVLFLERWTRPPAPALPVARSI